MEFIPLEEQLLIITPGGNKPNSMESGSYTCLDGCAKTFSLQVDEHVGSLSVLLDQMGEAFETGITIQPNAMYITHRLLWESN